jgi:uncharacterized protein involved in exopolysaccharide biosynthesis
MSSNMDSLLIRLSSVETRAGEVLNAAVASLWRRKVLVATIVASAFVLGLFAVLLLPKRYTAEAYIRGGFVVADTATKDKETTSAGSISLDLVRVIETESRLLQSHELARRVVQQLGLERLAPEVKQRRWRLFGSAVNQSDDQDDAAATQLLRHLSVTSDPRAYLVTVRYSAEDPELAVLITNSFVAEFLRSIELQALFQQRASAQATLSKQLAKYGDKHPRVAGARMTLVTTDGLLKQQLSEAPEAILQTAGENVTKAIAAPSGPHSSLVIGLLLVLGLVVGAGVALALERGRWWRAFYRYYAGPLAWPGGDAGP